VTPAVLLVPWWLPLLWTGSATGLALDIGRLPMATVTFADLVTGHLGDAGAPAFLGLAMLAVAVLALLPAATRVPVLVCWIVALSAAVVALALGLVTFERAAVTTKAGLGFLVLVIQAAFVVAAVIAAQGIWRRPARSAWWRRGLVGIVGVASVAPLVGLGWFVVNGPGDLEDVRDSGIPAYMRQSAGLGPSHGILVVEGDVDTGLTWTVQREDGLTVGEDEIVGLMTPDPGLDRDVLTLVSSPEEDAAATLPGHGIAFVVLSDPVDGNVAAVLDATTGLEGASADDRSTRAWRVTDDVEAGAVEAETAWWRIVMLALQGLLVLVVAVLCVPTHARGERS